MKKVTKKLIYFAIRKYLDLGKFEGFRFANQKSSAIYWFDSDVICKTVNGVVYDSTVSLNWLMDDKCEIVRDSDPLFETYDNLGGEHHGKR